MARPLTELRPLILSASDRNDWDTVFSLCEELEQIGDDAAMSVVLRQRGYYRILQGHYDEALDLLRRAEAYARKCDPPLELAPILNNQGMAYVWKNDPDTGEQLINQAIELYTSNGDRRGVARALHNLGLVCERRADWVKGFEVFSETLAINEELGDRLGIMRSLSCVALMSAHLGRHQESLEQYSRAYAISVEENVPEDSARFLSGMANRYGNMGDYEMALRLSFQALDVIGEHTEPRFEATVQQYVGLLFAQMGDLAVGIEYLQRALDIAKRVNYDRMIGYCLANIGHLLVRSGSIDDALAYYDQAITWCRDKNLLETLVFALSNCAMCQIKMGALEQAQALINEAKATQVRGKFKRPYVSIAQAKLFLLNGKHDEAAHELAEFDVEQGFDAELVKDICELRRDIAFKRNDLEAYVKWNEKLSALKERTQGGETQRKMSSLVASRQMEQERRDHQRHLELLHTMLPKDIATRIIAGEKVIGDRFEHAAVLFADIVGFTERSAEMQPEDVVTLLDSIYNQFDAACLQHGVTKIKTMGDSYICFCGQRAGWFNVDAVLHVAQVMISVDARWPSNDAAAHEGDPVQLRVGIHVGPVAAGVLGTQRLQYDIWGDTVNLASRLESMGAPGRVQVSQNCIDALRAVDANPTPWQFEERGEVEIKGKGTTRSYWLV